MSARTPDLLALLAARFSPPEWAFLPEVRDAAGFAASRTADAIAMNLWPSRGLEIHGCEIKVSRADWLRELKRPAKAEAFMGMCDRWWIVVADKSLIAPGELPPTWGLLVPRGKGLGVEVEAPKLAAQPPDNSFVAVLLRKATTGMIPAVTIDERIEAAREDGRQAGLNGVERAHRDLAALQASVDQFERVSGVRIDSWTGPNVAKVVRHVLDHGADRFRREVESRRSWAKSIIDDCDSVLTAMPTEPTTDPAPHPTREAAG